MDNEGWRETHPQSWSNAEWRRAGTNTSSVDLADEGLVSGGLDEQRSFGARPAPVALGHVVLSETRGPHEVWAHSEIGRAHV